MLMRSGSTMSLSNRSKMPIPSDPSAEKNRTQKAQGLIVYRLYIHYSTSLKILKWCFSLEASSATERTRINGIEVDVNGL